MEANILRRLKAVDATSVMLDLPVIERVLENYLDFLELSRRPLTWARDGRHALSMISSAGVIAASENLDGSVDELLPEEMERQKPSWAASYETAKAAAQAEHLDLVKGLLQGQSVLLSIPWRLYAGRFTGDRGARTDPGSSRTWMQVGDVLDYSARAAAACTWARAGSQRQLHPDYERVLLPFVDAYEAGLWLFWITEEKIIALQRPRLQVQAKQLHCADGPAVSWPAAEEPYFFLNGVHVPREIVETPARELDPRLMLREENAQVRREIVRKVGIERVCEALNAQCLDRAGNYELLLLDLQDGRHRPFLKMKNPSVGVYHIEGVAPECRTVAEALAWRNQSDVPPSILT